MIARMQQRRESGSDDAAGQYVLRLVRETKRSSRTVAVAGLWIDRCIAVIDGTSATGDVLTGIHARVERHPSRFCGVHNASLTPASALLTRPPSLS